MSALCQKRTLAGARPALSALWLAFEQLALMDPVGVKKLTSGHRSSLELALVMTKCVALGVATCSVHR